MSSALQPQAASVPTEPVTLLPCPFCGGEARYSVEGFYFCGCGVQGPEAPVEGEPGMARQDAALLWNRRAEPPKPAPIASDAAGGLREALLVIANASERSETMFGGKMSDVTRVFQNISRVARAALSAPPVHAGEADEAHKHTWELEPRSGITLCSEPTCRVPKMRKHEAEEPWLASDHDDYCESRRGFDCNCITYIVNSASRTFARDLAALLKDRRK